MGPQDMNGDLPEIATVEETAALLGVSRWTLANWRKQRKEPQLRWTKLHGRHIRYNRADVLLTRAHRQLKKERGVVDAAPG
jgi:excisionase family DNA binding protein